MTSKERNELVRLVKARFRLLRMQAKARAWEIVESENERAEMEAAEASRAFRDRLDELNAQAKPLFDAAQDVIREADEAGLHWSGRLGHQLAGDVRFTSKKQRSRFHWSEKVETAIVVEVDRMELAVLEELLMGELESDEARAFLGKIPTIDGLTSGKEMLEIIDV